MKTYATDQTRDSIPGQANRQPGMAAPELQLSNPPLAATRRPRGGQNLAKGRLRNKSILSRRQGASSEAPGEAKHLTSGIRWQQIPRLLWNSSAMIESLFLQLDRYPVEKVHRRTQGLKLAYAGRGIQANQIARQL